MIAAAFRSWKQARRIRAAEAEILSRRGRGRAHGLPAPLIVSLTSYPPRFARLHLVLRSLLTQSVAADRVVLWLAEGDEQLLPAEVTALPVEIRSCPDWRSYKKIVPTLLAHPDSHIVTADDDVYYGPDWLAGLVAGAGAGVVSHRAHLVALRDGRPEPYSDWQRNLSQPQAGPLVFPTGVGGVLYAPGVFHPDVTDAALFQALAPSADDVWLYWMHRLRGSRPEKIGGRFRITEWPGTQAQNLRSSNLVGDGNDRAVAAMLQHYGWPAP
ncbi:glycosyltransferase family 2 protein [Paracoccus limosus]|uniref:Glycosyltransferase family 2 protein n=1 Tax=Paracoccus limosus TaxID=913252 RepID=A0A844H667_9RHOB|nr:glycosyltransferase family 2 protein [Paracoccus limosus]MTH36499.1 glycosyltransferase family 2 protein [Paracoccus limosus]